jgi:hypothetical protein
MDMNVEDKNKMMQAVTSIIERHEQGYIVLYEDINDLIKSLGGVPSVDVNTQSTSVLCYLNALLIRALLG